MHFLYYSLVHLVLSCFHRSYISPSSSSYLAHPTPHRTARQQFRQSSPTLHLLFASCCFTHVPLSSAVHFSCLSFSFCWHTDSTNFTVCTLNIRSFLYPFILLPCLLTILTFSAELKPGIRPTTTSAEIFNCTPTQLHLTQCPAQRLWLLSWPSG